MFSRAIDSLFVLLLALGLVLLTAAPAFAVPARIGSVEEAFATCAGRMGAMATRARAFGQVEAEEFDQLRDIFDDLLAALSTDENAAKGWRNAGWTEIAQLLSEIDFGIDGSRAVRSGDTLSRRIRTCRGLVLPQS